MNASSAGQFGVSSRVGAGASRVFLAKWWAFCLRGVALTACSDLNPSAFSPPLTAQFRQSELPAPSPGALLSDSELGELRLRPAQRSERPEVNAPKSGLLLVNHSESLRYVSVDGALAARLAPGAELLLSGLHVGKYQISARDFLSGEDALSKIVEVPARFVIGEDLEKAH